MTQRSTNPAVAILGFGAEGQSSYRYWRPRAKTITICDANAELDLNDLNDPEVIFQTGPDYLRNLDQFDIIVRTPGLNPALIASANRPNWDQIKANITTQVNEFIRLANNHIIAVTGSKGKGTTCRLIESLLQSTGRQVIIGGNIGEPALNLLEAAAKDPEAIVVLEISSFQTIDLTQPVQTAVILPISPDHLNYHGNENAYIDAKANLLRQQTKAGVAVIGASRNRPNIYFRKNISAAKTITYGDRPEADQTNANFYVKAGCLMNKNGPIMTVACLKNLPGDHNIINLSAAVAAISPLLDDIMSRRKDLETAVSKQLPNRFRYEPIKHPDYPDLQIINDSGATSPEATLAALKTAGKAPKILIVGGQEKGLSINNLIKALADRENNIKHLICLGPGGAKIASRLKQMPFPVDIDPGSMTTIVKTALNAATAGDIILLSPGFTSFGQFKNSTDRGQQFETAILNAQRGHQ